MKYLVTGGTGFLGKELIKRLKGNEIVVVARNEGKLIELKQESPEIEIVTGDIADNYVARKVVKGVDGIFHLAAFKHVGMAESQPKQCIQSNVSGSMALLQAIDQKPYKFIIGISTDKAAQVAGVYGATKLLMEKIFQQFEAYNPQTRYRIVRYGNVLYSTGSVLCKWKDALLNGKEIIVTDLEATRFYWTVDQAVDLIFECLDKAKDATPYVPAMKAMSIGNLLEAMQIKYGKAKRIKTIGLQTGENLAETMDGKVFSNEVEQFTINEIKELI